MKKNLSKHPIYMRLREVLNLETDRELADLLNVTPQSVNGWKRHGKIKRDRLESVARLTGVSLAWLLTGEGEKFPSACHISEQSINAERELLRRSRLTLSVQPLRVVPVVAGLENFQIVSREGTTMSIPQNVSSDTALTIEVLDDSWQPEGFKRGDVLIVERANGNCQGKLVVAIANGQPLIRHYEEVGKMACFSALYDQQPMIQIPVSNVDIQFVVNLILTKPA